MNLDKLVVFEVFLRYQTFYHSPKRWVTVIQTPWGPWPRPWPRSWWNHISDARPRSKLYFPKKIAAIDSSRIEFETMPSSLRAFEHGSPAVGALSVLRGNVCRDAGRWNECSIIFAMCAEQNTGKKQPHFFATKGWSWKIQQDFFSSTFVEFSGNSIWDGQHLWWVWGPGSCRRGRGWVPTTDRCFWWVGFTTKQDPL